MFWYNQIMKNANLSNIIFFSLILIVCIPYISTIIFSVPHLDDFWMVSKINSNFFDHIINSIKSTNNFYFSWGGCWPYIFVEYLINPIVLSDSTSYIYGTILNVFFIIFIIVFYHYFKSLFKLLFDVDIMFIRLYYPVVLFVLLNTLVYSGVFYFFVGNSYLWMIILTMLNQIYIFNFFQDKSLKNLMLLSIFGILACFAYQTAIFSGIIYLILIYINVKHNGTKDLLFLTLPLILMIFAGCLSVFAPGNFVRQNAQNAALKGIPIRDDLIELYKTQETSFNFNNITSAIKLSIKNTNNCVLNIVSNPFCIILCFLFFFSGLRNKRDLKYKIKSYHPVIIITINYLIIISLCFPISFGYSSGEIPNRAMLHINWSIIIMLIVASYFMGIWVKKFINGNMVKLIRILTVIIIFINLTIFVSILNINDDYKKNFPWFYTLTQINNCWNEKENTNNTLNYIKNSKEKVVVIDRELNYVNTETGVLSPLIISEDADSWNNRYLARYFEKEAIYLK